MNVPSGLARRGPFIPTIIIAGVLIVAFMVFTELWTEKLWFDSVSFQPVFNIQLTVNVVLFLLFFLIMAGTVGGNMWIAFRGRPVVRRTGESAILDRYRDSLESNALLAIVVPSLFFGLLAGLSAIGQTMDFIAWWHRTPFGVVDPYFGLDTGFYVFEYPVWRDLLGFVMSALLFSLMAAAAVHFAVGGLASGRPRISGARPSAARIHLSILAALLLVGYGLQNLLDRYGFLLDDGTLFTGLHYTDDNARLGAKLVMAMISFICAALFVLNAFLTRGVVATAGLVLMLVSGLILSLLYPAIVQSFQVRPNEPDKESPYMQAHMDATRAAFDLDDVEITEYAAVTQVRPGQLKEDAEALPGIRLIDPSVVSTTFDQLQQVRGYYAFPDVLDVDRYVLNGVETDAVVAAREMNLAGVPDPNWNNIHTVYTHGFGLVAAYGNRRQASGEPEWIQRDIPPVGELGEHESRIYFGEQSTQFVIVGREPGQAPIELDTPGGGEGGRERNNVYEGSGGVPIGDMFTRLLYAAHFVDLNIILSDRVNSASKLLYQRTPKERVQQVAPWLTLDSNVYPAVVDSRLVWIVDGYTTSASYPNSELVSLRSSTSDAQSRAIGTQIDEQVNYLRNSVKAVVDATDGTVTLYAWDEADPILQTYVRAFPGTVQPRSAISTDLLAHLRYPEDLFKVQREVLGRYHMTTPASWYQQNDLWQVPNDPSKTTTEAKEPPYYLSIKWPGDEAPIFSQTTVFVPKGRSNLASYLAVNSEASSPDYGKLRVLRMSDTQQIDGPGQTFNAMTTDEKVAEVLRPFLNQGSAAATFGNLLTLPMGAGLLYVLPVYTQRQGSTGSYPALRYVIVRFGEHVGIGETLQEALDAVFVGDAGADTGEEPTTEPDTAPGGEPTEEPDASPDDQAVSAAAMKKAEEAFVAADVALRNGDLGLYQEQVNEARSWIEQAYKALGR